MADAGAVEFLRSVRIKDIPLKRKGVVVLHRGDSVVKALGVRVRFCASAAAAACERE